MLPANSYSRRCRAGLPSSVIQSPGSYLLRPKLPSRSAYNKPKSNCSFTHIENAPFGRPKRFKLKKLNSFQKMDTMKKKIPDYTETAYREAVSRLKYLLAESYTPRGSGKIIREKNIFRRSNSKLHDSADDTDDRSVVSECSKGFPVNLSSRTNTALISDKRLPMNSVLSGENSQMTPKEMSTFIMRQEEYIEQLESESQYCKEELKNLLGKIREVVAENEALHDKNKTVLLKSFLNEYDNPEESSANKPTLELDHGQSSPGKKIKLHQMIEGPSIMYESRISELEAQLTQARIELKKAQEESQLGVKKFADAPDLSPESVQQLDLVMREKRELSGKLDETLRSLQVARDREADALQKAKRAMDSVQQTEFEKAQAESEVRRLKDELDRQRDKIREATQETTRRLADERHQVERRYGQQVEQLSADVATHWDAASKSQLEIEKQRREILDLKRELNQKQAIIDDLKKDLHNKISNLQSDLNQMAAEKDAVEQEVATAKLALERSERHAKQEQSRWQGEINSYKQRLERADADIVHCRRENLRLSEQIASLEKELNMVKIIRTDSQTPAATPRLENEKDLTSMIMDMETKHAATVAGLEDALKNQAMLVSQLSAECRSLTQRLDSNNLTHKEEIVNLQEKIDHLTNKIKDSLENQKGKLPEAPSKPQKNPVDPNEYTHETYQQNYNLEPKTAELEASQYDPQDNQNYPEYTTNDPNYTGEYAAEDYQYEQQYDPSLYPEANQEQSNQDTDQYENYSAANYENQQQPLEQNETIS
ncbi:serologically defined colon cancer antigen 8 homolog isoform X1 [Cotesia glomerata]|uniref:serologically defined colon cancer antigen 8 homolog isoform X1 n=1 Tax=Cotesia glomerata TaxID=32391 RepID=UPI001D00C220|nr:serologically defined colon cancer antigen 8 homolog isoform X1 [Cotesia glomerata]XP_044590404.1 serologically defined colon cancer antigen 8 homolog isoform X1 [Cotesia glomerata]